ncbi:flavin reductase family protein [Clostridium botulinum]|uniref:Flavin reductase n=1 Tax=Clostridium botulinum TaxID=1491 RepID=A0A9Q1V0H1_CLOBO|nr:flavin reductase family protein [Clostridium botulinum]KEI00905.1 flavin reductase [Clostridium botulinum C/D str. Sp77]KEI04194.1 flavin reductase [Clostridium botulinum D str. 16868]KLU75818.1 flavin reductase [Clostridium botulinum V891]KOA74660.1 flavin reductase [Clostridium botulinum]KOA77531.1 flavin reductase [Clostridium botulinum]
MSKKTFKGSAMLNPVPSVLITSKNNKGKVNVFTVGWIGVACTKPPMISVAIRPERLSYEYIKENNEFVVNLPSRNLVKAVDFCGVRSGNTLDKIKELNFTLRESDNISVPYIDECPITLECKVKNILPLGSHDLFLAEILSVHVEEDLIDEKGKIHYEKADLICYSHGEYFGVSKKALGSFGFSVKKKKNKKRKSTKNKK